MVCGNYSDSHFSSDCYAGGADGCQVRALLRTSALNGKLVAMEIPTVYKRLGLAKEGDVWLVRLAMGLTTSPSDWSKYRVGFA